MSFKNIRGLCKYGLRFSRFLLGVLFYCFVEVLHYHSVYSLDTTKHKTKDNSPSLPSPMEKCKKKKKRERGKKTKRLKAESVHSNLA